MFLSTVDTEHKFSLRPNGYLNKGQGVEEMKNYKNLIGEDGNLKSQLDHDPYYVPPFEENNFSLERFLIPSDVGGKYTDLQGLWTFFGYNVGWEGNLFVSRRRALVALFQSYLVPTNDSQKDYLASFGKPVSDKRLKRIISYWETQLRDKTHMNRMKRAVQDWEKDRKWFMKYLANIKNKDEFELVPGFDDSSRELQYKPEWLI
jgi:hypothetical protein